MHAPKQASKKEGDPSQAVTQTDSAILRVAVASVQIERRAIPYVCILLLFGSQGAPRSGSNQESLGQKHKVKVKRRGVLSLMRMCQEGRKEGKKEGRDGMSEAESWGNPISGDAPNCEKKTDDVPSQHTGRCRGLSGPWVRVA